MWILKDNSEVSVLFFSHMSFGWYFRSLGLVVRAFTSEPSCLSHITRSLEMGSCVSINSMG